MYIDLLNPEDAADPYDLPVEDLKKIIQYDLGNAKIELQLAREDMDRARLRLEAADRRVDSLVRYLQPLINPKQ